MSAPRCAAIDELEVLIRARYPVIYVVSWEEERVERHLNEIATRRNKKFHVWTSTQGLVKYGAEAPKGKSGSSTNNAVAAMDAVLAHTDPGIFLMKDLHMWLTESPP